MLKTHNVIHALGPDALVHLLVAVQLVRHGPEQAGPVLAHLLDHVALPPHDPLEPHVLLPPLLLGQVLTHVTVLVLAVVPLLLLLVISGRGLVATPMVGVAGSLAAGCPVYRIVILVQRVERRVTFLRRPLGGGGHWGGDLGGIHLNKERLFLNKEGLFLKS